MAKQGKCSNCKLHIVWEKNFKLSNMYCPVCGGDLERTSKLLDMPTIDLKTLKSGKQVITLRKSK